MAVFTNLFHVSDALRHILHTRIGPSNGVIAAPPPDTLSTIEEIRVSLMWINEQPAHRNDAPHRRPDGTSEQPPATLSVYYLITTYGEGPLKNADAAHRLLGEVVRLFHAEPVISFPIAGLAGNSGEGRMGVTLVPMTPESMEKIFVPLQIKHRPFLLYEVGPVQLKSPVGPGAPGPVVAPTGIRLSGPTPTKRPVLSRLVPTVQAEGGFLRIDGVFDAQVDAVLVGSTRIPSANIDVLRPGSSIRVALPTGGPGAVGPGVHRVSVVTGNLHADPAELFVVNAGQWTLDGPAATTHAQSEDLVLTGQGLDNADAVYVWPDSGIRAPSDVREFIPPPDGVTATSITVKLDGLRPGEYRVAARINPGAGVPAQFTPYVVLEITP